MNIAVLTPEKTIFNGAVEAVKVPGILGEFQVLNNHAPIISALQEGKVEIRKQGGEMLKFTIEKGFIEVLQNEVSLLIRGYQA